MALSTRLRARKREENIEPTKMIIGKASAVLKPSTLLDAKEKRRAFGDIENRIGSGNSTSQEDKPTKPIAFKDVKPRVDTRWKKTEVTASLRPGKTSTISAIASSLMGQSSTSSLSSTASSKPVLRQPVRPKIVAAEPIPQLRKVSSKPEVKKSSSGELQLIRSPRSYKPAKEKVETEKNFYESHSSKMLHQVENIDERDIDNPQMLAEYVQDIYEYLFKLERRFPIRENFLATQTDVTPKMRSVLLDWINEVHHQFTLENETYHMAVSMIDRYLQSTVSTPRRSLQLVGVTTLFMASKYEELMPPEISDFVYVTDDTYTKQQILNMEKRIFEGLGFNLSKPLPIHFLRRFAKAAGSLGDRQYIAAKYFMELASIDYEMTKYLPSQIAAASLYLALYIFNTIKSDKDVWTGTLQYYSTYKSADLMPIMKRLATIVYTAREVKLKSVFNKYSHSVFKFTSTLPEMTGTKIQEIVNHE